MKLLPPENTAAAEETKAPGQKALLSLKELCQELSISTATGRNWIRQKKLTPKYMENQVPYFTEDYLTALKMEMHSGRNAALKSRRNKSFISGNALYRSYVSENFQNVPLIQKLLKYMKEEELSPGQAEIACLAADCALHLFSSKGKFLQKETLTQKNTSPQESLPCGSSLSKEPFIQEPSKPLLLQYLNGELCFPRYAPLLDALVKDREAALCFCEMHPCQNRKKADF